MEKDILFNKIIVINCHYLFIMYYYKRLEYNGYLSIFMRVKKNYVFDIYNVFFLLRSIQNILS